MSKFLFVLFVIAICFIPVNYVWAQGDYWNNLRVSDEYRCAQYNREEYKYPQSVELKIIEAMDGYIYSPYTNEYFESRMDTDIEHIVAVSEAHDSGLCATPKWVKRKFARDLRNLTLASPILNRHIKRDKDATDWLPQYNRCWYVARILEVKLAYDLSVDEDEAAAMDYVISNCANDEEVICLTDTAPSPYLGAFCRDMWEDISSTKEEIND